MTPDIAALVPPDVLAAFEGRPHLTMPQLARAIMMDLKTLGRHRQAGIVG